MDAAGGIAPNAAVDRLRSTVSGPVIVRGEQGFREEIAGYNLAGPVDPDVVVGAASEQDVVAAVSFAAAHQLPVYAQATGHGNYASIGRGVLIQTSRINTVHVDPETRLATIGAGAPWSTVYETAAPHGLAPVTGSAPGVSAVGLILGGGIGPLSRTYGFAADHAREFRVVLEDGRTVIADPENEPDLFWALRGGKGGLGVVTEVKVRLVEQETLYAGGLFFAREHAAEAFHTWLDWTRRVPDEVTSSVCLVRFPPLEDLPRPLRGRTILHIRCAYTGQEDPDDDARRAAGEQHIAALRAVGERVMDTVGIMPAALTGTVHQDPPDPMPVWEQGALLNAIDHDFIDTLFHHVGPEADVPLNAVEVRHIGGAMKQDRGGAIGGRSADYTLVLIGRPETSLFEKTLPVLGAAVEKDVQKWYCAETNYNFAGCPKTAEDFARNWPAETFERLVAVRDRYDPARRFPIGSHQPQED